MDHNGNIYWRLKYQLMGKRKLLAFGVWPEVSLTEACKKRNEAKLILKSVNDPSVKKKSKTNWTHYSKQQLWFSTLVSHTFPCDCLTNSSQSDTLHNNIYKEQGKDPFYSEFVFQSIINMLRHFWIQSKRKWGQKSSGRT